MRYNYDLKDVDSFMLLARAGSITQASLIHNIPKATLSHHLLRLEDSLGVELFTRKPKGLELTDAGREYLDHCGRIFESCEMAASAAQRAHSSVSGRVRIAASAEFGTTIIGAAAYYIASQYPKLDFDLQMHPNNKLIAGQTEFDCMIYVGDAPDSNLLRRKMGDVSNGLYASPAFLERHGIPLTLEDIRSLDGVVYHQSGIAEEWVISDGKLPINVSCYPRFTVNEYWMAKYFTVEGSTIAYLPDFFVRYEVASGALVSVLPQWRSTPTAVSIIYPAHRHKNPRVMGLVDALCSKFEEFITHPGYSLIKRSTIPQLSET